MLRSLIVSIIIIVLLFSFSYSLGLDLGLVFTAGVSIFLAFLMVIAVYVAVVQLRASVDSSEKFVDQLVKVSGRIAESNENLERLGQTLLSLLDVMASESGKVPKLIVAFTDGTEEVTLSHGERVIPLLFQNSGSLPCRNAFFDLILPKDTEAREGEGYENTVGTYGEFKGRHRVLVSSELLRPDYHFIHQVNIYVPSTIVGKKELLCFSSGDNCEGTQKKLVMNITA